MRACRVEPLIERTVRAFERLEAHRAGDVCRDAEALCFEEGERAERCHVLRPVDQRETLFRLEDDGRNACLAKDFSTGSGRARSELRLPLSDHREREMGERSEIARSTNR